MFEHEENFGVAIEGIIETGDAVLLLFYKDNKQSVQSFIMILFVLFLFLLSMIFFY
jgi:hypothetical protein